MISAIRRSFGPRRLFLMIVALIWLFPIVYAVFNSLRSYDYTSQHGYLSFGGFTFDNYINAWRQADFGRTLVNSAIITVPSVILTLALAACAAFVIARRQIRLTNTVLTLFVAANLLPPQALLTPVYRMFRAVEVPTAISDSGTLLDSYAGLIAINVAFQLGFCVFVLANFMRALPDEIFEAARIDGASLWRTFVSVTVPLCRPALAALATLQVTWIYNEFFWATVLLQSGSKFPVTSSLNNLRGQFFSDTNLLAAGSVIIAVPTIVVFFALQKHFVAGLTLGATKG